MIGQVLVEYLDIVMFLVLCAAILLGFPVVFTLTGIGVLFAGLGWLLGAFPLPLLGALGQRIFGIMTSSVLVAIPLFIFMGIVLERSRIAEDLLETMGRLFGTLRGGLAISVVAVGALLAASTGIVGATVVTMGLIALPSMLRHGYDRKLAAGTVVTAGTLGQIIPPSTMLIILSEVMSTAYQQAQFRQGLFTVETISVGQVFAAALMPGLMLVGVYLAYVVARAVLSPGAAPALRAEEAGHVGILNVVRMLVPPIVLIVAVLGSILGGLATPTEAAAVGAIGAILLAGFRLSEGRSSKFLGLCVTALIAVIALATVVTRSGVARQREIGTRHARHLPRSLSQPNTGKLSEARIRASQRGQREGRAREWFRSHANSSRPPRRTPEDPSGSRSATSCRRRA